METANSLALAVDAAQIGTWDYDIAAGAVRWSRRTEEIFGLAEGSFAGTPAAFAALVHPGDRKSVNQDVDRCIATCGSHAMVFRIVRPDGAVRWVQGIGRVIAGADGRAARMMGVVLDVTERRKQEVMARGLLESSPNIIYVYSVVEQRYLYVSPQSEPMLGYPPQEIIARGKDWLPEVIHPEDVERLSAKLVALSVARDGEVVSSEYRVRHRNGEWRVVGCRNVVFSRLPNGQLEQFLGVVTDTTGYHAGLAAVQESETRLRLATEAAQIGIWHMELPGEMLTSSQSMQRIFGLQGSELNVPCETFHKLVHPADIERVEQLVNRCIEECGHYQVDFRIVRPDGTTRWVGGRGQALAGADGRAERVVGLVMDVTERKQAEDALQQSEERYREVVDTQTELVCRFMPDSTLTFVNEAYCRYFGKVRSELIGRRFIELIPEGARSGAMTHLKQLLVNGSEPLQHEHQVTSAGGTVRWQEWINHVIRDEDGRVIELQGIGRDVTARREAEDALREALAELKALKNRLEAENTYLQAELAREGEPGQIVMNSAAMRSAVELAQRVAPSKTSVLLVGETGTGKGLLAATLHRLSGRNDRPLIRMNCAALPAHLIESELFGHERGAFTGAAARRLGRFEIADGATLFLDEIGELPLELQAKLLRVVQEGELERLGSSRTIAVNVRIIAATNRNLAEAVERGTFRADLYYRLNVFPIAVPPLRSRMEDIVALASSFLAECGRRLGRSFMPIPPEVAAALISHRWPGNVRELENVIERAAILSPGRMLELPVGWNGAVQERAAREPQVAVAVAPGLTEGRAELRTMASIQEVERSHIRSVLERTNWKVEGEFGAAAILGINPSTLRFRMKKLGIARTERASRS